MAFFSLIIPVYNVERYLKKCVDSILNQTFQDFEIILVDDGSPDNCPMICDEYAENDERIKVIHKKNGGLVSARKAGMNVAQGEYIVTVDSDDWIAEDLLQTLFQIINENKCDVICYNFYIAGDKYDPIIHRYKEGLFSDELINRVKQEFLYDPARRGFNNGSLANSIWTKTVKRDLYVSCQSKVPNDIVKGEDLVFTIYLLNNCHSIYMSDFIGYYYRVNQDSIMHTYKENDIKQLCRLSSLLLEINYENTEAYRNKVYVYTFVIFWDMIKDVARQKKTKLEYCNFMTSEYPAIFDAYFNGIGISKGTIKDKIKLVLVKKHMWEIVYYGVKYAKL